MNNKISVQPCGLSIDRIFFAIQSRRNEWGSFALSVVCDKQADSAAITNQWGLRQTVMNHCWSSWRLEYEADN